MRVACVQLTAGADKAANLEQAERLVARAAATGADLVLLPEKWNGVGGPATLESLAEPLEGGESVAAMSRWARTHGISLVGGSITERREGREKLSNTSLAFDPEGALVAVYRKIHLFDVDVAGVRYRESDAEEPGDEPVVATLEDWPVGLTVCYDLRFPELYRILALEGAELVTVPANFTERTGRDHWEVLLRARAIENQCYVAAAGQVGEPMPGRPSFGRSLIADPWGTVLAQAPDEETAIVADVDRARVRDVRASLPALANRRPESYRWPAPA
ncbi:MAG: carbon-nitrogen hydrolase family protein [Actinomycetota bacterium]|nr:carbon-nitrogen hydrolase family protein [Actinomycetota bacterium]